MKKFSLIINNYVFFILSMFIYLVVISILSFLSYKVSSIISYIFIIVLFFISGYKLGNKSNKKGYLSGLLVGISNIIFMFILGVILKLEFNLNILLYYFTLILSSVIGGCIGINRKGSLD